MLSFAPKLPISDEERLWADEGFRRLERMLGRRRMIDAKVVLPSAEDFSEPYDKSAASAELLFRRVCNYMRVERSTVELEIFPDETEECAPYFLIGAVNHRIALDSILTTAERMATKAKSAC